MEKVYAMHDKVSDPSRQVGSFDPDSMPSLPIGINKQVGASQVIIAIDSAYFLPDGAYFSAYSAVEFPGAEQPLAFAAKDIKFNPKGIIGGEQSKLMLVSEHRIALGPNTVLYLPADGSNYLKWSCNGFESVNLHGYFLFQSNIISPPENSADSVVTAEFEINVSDLHNMMAMVDFSPFVVKGMEDFTFTVSEAYVDMSDYNNPMNVQMPQCYHNLYTDDISLWRGFYLKSFNVKLPEELNKAEEPIVLYANEMFIDDAGVTGTFAGSNLFSTNQNAMDNEWGFSVDSLAIGLTLNHITKGNMKGEIKVPPLDNTSLEYNALISQNTSNGLVDFNFDVSFADNVSFSCANSTLELYESSCFKLNRIGRKFVPKVILNGDWTLNNSNFKVSGLEFENFTLSTRSPYVLDGYFSLVSNSSGSSTNQAGGFPISISDIGFGLVGSQPAFGAKIALNIGGEEEESSVFSAETEVRVLTKIQKNPSTNKTEWNYDKFQMNTIELEVNTTAITLEGYINFNDNHPVYGKGFYGGLAVGIPSIMDNELSMACAFGRVDGYRYWMVDATVPVNIPMGSITLSSISGGVAYHMKNTKTKTDLINDVSPTENSGDDLAANYVPDQNMGLFFKAGVGFKNTMKEETLNGDVMFSISFNSNGGLSEINLSGNAYMLCKVSERQNATNYAHGAINIDYDNQEKKLDAQLSVDAVFSNVLTADIWAHLYFSPGLWYVHLGHPSNPCSANIIGLVTANAYFMMGQQLPPMPPPPPQVASVFNTMNDQRDETSIAGGNGIACGMNFSAGFNKAINISDNHQIYGSGTAGAGFDMTLYKYAPGTHCEGSSAPFGMNYWYLNGQLYCYLGINAGVRKVDDWDFNILEGNVAVLLQGKMPKPSYVYGGIYLQASILGFIDVAHTFDFEFGTNCIIVNG